MSPLTPPCPWCYWTLPPGAGVPPLTVGAWPGSGASGEGAVAYVGTSGVSQATRPTNALVLWGVAIPRAGCLPSGSWVR